MNHLMIEWVKSKYIFGTILIMYILFSGSNVSLAQAVPWDSISRPAIYEARAGQFRSFASSRKDIIFLGNSITAYGNWSELLKNKHAKNRGIPGDNTFGILDRLNKVIEGKPAKVFILAGINDIGKNIPDSVIIKNYKRIVRKIKQGSPKTKIYIQTLLPVNNSFTPGLSHFNKDEHILWINSQLKKLAIDENIHLIDLYPYFLDSEKKLDRNLSFDGLHLNDKGYLKWAALLKNEKYIK